MSTATFTEDQKQTIKNKLLAQPHPKLELVGQDGNAFMVLGLAQRAARKAKWSDDEWHVVRDEMMSGDYNHLLATTMNYFEVS